MNQPTLFETARYIGNKIREVDKLDRAALEKDDFRFNIHFLVGGQIAGFAASALLCLPAGQRDARRHGHAFSPDWRVEIVASPF